MLMLTVSAAQPRSLDRSRPLECYWLGLQPYVPVWQAMRLALRERATEAPDELWAVEHPSVLTLGRNAREEHVLQAGSVPLVRIDRGGQVTLHAPGQLVLYTLLDLRRHGLGVRRLVSLLEDAMIHIFAMLGIQAFARTDAPGVYVGSAKLAAIGLRIRDGYCMHGVAINTRNRLDSFARINPCGYAGLAATSLEQLGVGIDPASLAMILEQELADRLGLVRRHRPMLPSALVCALALRARAAPDG
jgi:lipoyl(octanoyl) transferase